MTVNEAKTHFGSKAAIGRALGIGKAAVSKWGELIPRAWAAELHVRTKGQLKFDPAEYDQKPADDQAA